MKKFYFKYFKINILIIEKQVCLKNNKQYYIIKKVRVVYTFREL